MRFPALRPCFPLAAGSAIFLLAGCSQEAPPPPPPPAVQVITVSTQPVANVIELPGRVQATRTAEVRARVDGIVQQRLYQEGSDVRSGQALFSIDPRALRASLAAVRATLSRAQSNAANAQQDVNRYRPLLVDQAISRQEFDTAMARLRAAQADVAQARAQVQGAELSLSYATVRAPISGRAGRAQITEGALVNAAAGTLMTTIEQISPVFVNFSQSSSDLLALRRNLSSGQLGMQSLNRVEVKLKLEDGSIYPVVGHIDFLDLAVDEATGTVALRAEFANPQRMLLPGQFVRAVISAGTSQGGIVVPQRAIKLTQQGGTVMVVGPRNIVEARQIRLGNLQGGNWVVLGGLKAGDKVIVNGLQKAQPGQPVRITSPANTPAARAKSPRPASASAPAG